MEKIKEFKVSLLKKDTNFSLSEEGKGNYIKKATGSFKPEEFFKNEGIEIDKDQYHSYIYSLVKSVYDNILIESKTPADAVGLWFILENGEILENALDIAVLSAMEEYGDNIVPIIEFTKMTLEKDESEEDI
jgi:hypothetical protein